MALTDIFTFNFNNAVEQTRQIPVTTVPVGITVLQAAITRGSLDPAIVLAWSIEVSRDGGTTWRPWGAAGTTGGNVFNKDGSLATESYFTLFLETPADAQTRVRGSLTNTGARMTTTITIRGDTTPILQRVRPPDHHSVVYDNSNHVEGGAVTTLTTSSFTITSSASRAALLGLIAFSAGSSSGFTSTCGTVSGALVTSTDVTSGAGLRTLIHRVIAPASGSQTGSMSWTTAVGGCSLGVMTASAVDQSTPTNNGNTANSSGTTATITITTAVGDLTFAIGNPTSALSAPTQTQVWLDTGTTGGGGSRGPGSGTSNIHSWTQSTNAAYVMSGCNLVATAAAPTFDFSFADFPKEKLRQPTEVSP
jgi:hypothetical protein